MAAESRQAEWRFEGVASSTALDRQRERMTREALAGLEGRRTVALVLTHGGTEGAVGQVEECRLEDGRLRVWGRLGNAAAAQQLRERMARGERMGLSLGGKVTRAHWGWDAGVEGPVRHLDEVTVEHVVVCPVDQVVNPEAWVRLVGESETAG